MNYPGIEKAIRDLLVAMDQDLSDDNFRHTPNRYARLIREMFDGKEPEWTTFAEDYTDFVMLRKHRIWTFCPHHLLLVEMIVTIAYIPQGEVLGLSKLARILHETNRGPMLQERFGRESLRRLMKVCRTSDCAIFIIAKHGCMQARGIQSTGDVVTYRLEGMFDKDPTMQQRFFTLARD